jgi:hypothetical protein
MNCLSEMTGSMFVDGELAAEETRRVEQHLGECPRCRALVQAMRTENEVIVAAFEDALPAAAAAAGLRGMAREFALVVAVLATVGMAAQWLSGVLPGNLDWLNPFTTDGSMNLFFSAVFYLRQDGPGLLGDLAAALASLLVLLMVVLGLRLLWRRPAALRSGLLVALTLGVALPGWGLTRRTGQTVTVAHNETLDDTLFAKGETVDIDGVVNGDVIMGGRLLNVRGTVKGNVFAWGEQLEISGTVEGSVFCFGQRVEMRGGRVAHSLYGWTQFLRLEPASRVEQDVIQASQHAEFNGLIARNVLSFSGAADVTGEIGRNFTIRTGAVTLDTPAKIGGDFNAYVKRDSNVHIAPGVTVAGKRETHISVRRNRYTRPSFYLWNAVFLAGAFIVGWLLLAFVPRFYYAAAGGIASWGRSLGLGAAILLVTPVAIVISCVTLVGLPLGLLTLLLYMVAIYLAKIFVAGFLGNALLGPGGQRERLLGLFVGLLILTVATALPYVGGVVAAIILTLGLGALGWQLYRELQGERAPA